MIGDEKLSNQEVVLAARGVYLLHGGTPEGWKQMRPDDVQLIYLLYDEERTRAMRLLAKKS